MNKYTEPSKMKTGYLVFGASLIVVTIASRAVPMGSTITNNTLFGVLSLFALGLSYTAYSKFRSELKRIERPARAFPLMIGFITLVLLIQVAMRISQH